MQKNWSIKEAQDNEKRAELKASRILALSIDDTSIKGMEIRRDASRSRREV
jgi:hypothetical protein